ncbi:hypothetical protein ACFSC6_10635 [Rufibacter sediminis]|uniref:Uncharacterized protein n=1 Tax=Rufibacter sediminis TaxID=2762756 RepID=A0ABR6VPB8_9BACT|nr:hypothetical protein [Rufibacter sediminis]MBC3538990.1 hypothetical protein [Rufibacter sediminis]
MMVNIINWIRPKINVCCLSLFLIVLIGCQTQGNSNKTEILEITKPSNTQESESENSLEATESKAYVAPKDAPNQ